MRRVVLFVSLLLVSSASADHICFSPVKEKEGDKSTERSFWQKFDYKIQVDDGPIVSPSPTESTKYDIDSKSPWVKIYLGKKLVESFEIKRQLLEKGRNCVYFKNIYETWSVVEKWQTDKLCSCDESDT